MRDKCQKTWKTWRTEHRARNIINIPSAVVEQFVCILPSKAFRPVRIFSGDIQCGWEHILLYCHKIKCKGCREPYTHSNLTNFLIFWCIIYLSYFPSICQVYINFIKAIFSACFHYFIISLPSKIMYCNSCRDCKGMAIKHVNTCSAISLFFQFKINANTLQSIFKNVEINQYNPYLICWIFPSFNAEIGKYINIGINSQCFYESFCTRNYKCNIFCYA